MTTDTQTAVHVPHWHVTFADSTDTHVYDAREDADQDAQMAVDAGESAEVVRCDDRDCPQYDPER